MLKVENIHTSYGAIEALRGVDLEANDGDVTCLLGPNGAGKTTLMMTIAGILQPGQGTINFNGENLVNLSSGQIIDKGIALVPENRLVFPEMTVRDNLVAGAYSRLCSGQAPARQPWRPAPGGQGPDSRRGGRRYLPRAGVHYMHSTAAEHCGQDALSPIVNPHPDLREP